MTPDILIKTLTQLFPEFASLLGVEWPVFQHRLATYLDALESTSDFTEEEALYDSILGLFSEYPTAHNRLIGLLMDRSGRAPFDPEMRHSLLSEILERLRRQHRLYFIRITHPDTVWSEVTRFAVSILLSATAPDLHATPILGRVDKSLLIRLDTADFQILGPVTGSLSFAAAQAEPGTELRFLCKPTMGTTGMGNLNLVVLDQDKPVENYPIRIKVHTSREYFD